MTTDEDILIRLAGVIREFFNCPNKAITRSTRADEIIGWDSLAHTMVLMKVEDVFGIELPMERAFILNNVGELADLVADAQAG